MSNYFLTLDDLQSIFKIVILYRLSLVFIPFFEFCNSDPVDRHNIKKKICCTYEIYNQKLNIMTNAHDFE